MKSSCALILLTICREVILQEVTNVTKVEPDNFTKNIFYQASIAYYGKHICSGAVISLLYVITAADKIYFRPVKTISCRAGSANYNSGGQVRRAISIKTHDNFNSRSKENNVCLVKPDKPFTSEIVRPIAILRNDLDTDTIEIFFNGWIKGSDSPSIQIVQVKIQDSQQCERHMSEYYNDYYEYPMYCAEAKDKSCLTDSSGLLISNINNITTFVGMMCLEPSCDGDNNAAICTPVAYMTEFIDKYIKEK